MSFAAGSPWEQDRAEAVAELAGALDQPGDGAGRGELQATPTNDMPLWPEVYAHATYDDLVCEAIVLMRVCCTHEQIADIFNSEGRGAQRGRLKDR